MNKNDVPAEGMGQGVGGKTVWDSLLPIFYSHPMLMEAYLKQSDLVVDTALRYLGGEDVYQGSHGLDPFCGQGNTLCPALGKGDGPASLLASDLSPQMVDLLRALVDPKVSVRDYILARVGTMRGDWEEVIAALEERRRFLLETRLVKTNWFQQVIDFRVASAWDAPAFAEKKPFDFVIANQGFHWVVGERDNARKASGFPSNLTDSLVECLGQMRSALRPGGMLVLGQSSDFVVLDDDAEADQQLLGSGLTARPEYWDLNREINKELAEAGYKRDMPVDGDARTKIFLRSKLRHHAQASRFELLEFTQYSLVYHHDPVKAMKLRAPMWLGKVPPDQVSFEQRIEIIERAASRVAAANHDPLVEQFFVIALRAV